MKTVWKVLLLVLLNIIVSASVTYGVLYYWENFRNKEQNFQLVTVNLQPTETAIPMSADELTLAIETETETAAIPEESSAAEEPEPTPVIRGAKIEITIIRNPGVLDSEALRIVSNSDDVISLENWTLEDANGNLLTFPNIQLLRKGVFVEVYSRTGHTTPYELYWNREAAVWQSGETAVIKDMFGQIQATYRVP